MRLILTDESDVNHSYDISNCIYDPNSLVNIVGIPVLEKYFNDTAEGPDAVAEDAGSTILSSGCRSHFKWDHGKHIRHFNHPDSQLPYDPNSPVNIVGIPVLEKYFNDAAEGPDAVAEDDGITILSSGCCYHFKWTHGKHSRHFDHPDSQLPELCLY